ncbi:hypothetical protein TNCV_2816521 [Trichonephila clavipes]|nr:hypothetical protein TNCV_2816521 [Trichonephila clavipes]
MFRQPIKRTKHITGSSVGSNYFLKLFPSPFNRPEHVPLVSPLTTQFAGAASDVYPKLRKAAPTCLAQYWMSISEFVAEPDENGNVIEQVVDLLRQINLEVDSDDVQTLLHSYNSELTVDKLKEMKEQEQDNEDIESLDPVQSEDRMTVVAAVAKVTDSWLACPEFEHSTSENPPYRGGRCTLNMSMLKSPPIGVVWNDEAHFWLNGYVNKQNCSIWSEANPQVYVETPLHPEKLTVWCALWAGGILLQKR